MTGLLGKLAAGLIGLFIVWMAVTMALGDSLIRPSATEPEDPAARVQIVRTWYGEAARYGASGLLAFFGVTLAVAPWRRKPTV